METKLFAAELNETRDSYFWVTVMITYFTSLHYIYAVNSKNTKHRHILLSGTDHCNSKCSKNI